MRCARECLDEIVSLYQDGSHENFNELLDRIVDLYFLTLEQQTAEEKDSFGDVMLRVSRTAGVLARTHFAERLCHESDVPSELLRELARDEICIARPILQYSSGLLERDLVAISSEADQAHLAATAHRSSLTVPVTDVLVSRGNRQVLLAVAQNVGADLSSHSIARLVEAGGNAGVLHDILGARRDTAPSPISKLKRLGEAEFWQRVAETLLMSAEEIEDDGQAEKQQKKAAEGKTEPESKPEDSKPRATDIFKPTSASNEKLLVEASRSGRVVEAVDVLAAITKLDRAMVEHCLFHAHLPALMVLCKAHKLSASSFTSLLQLRENYNETPVTDTISLLRRYEAMTPDTAQRVIRFADKGRHEPAPEPGPA